MKCPFARITICGVGLIGGSLALATKRAFPEAQVLGIDRRRHTLQIARRIGAIDGVASDPGRALAASALVILATPVQGILEWLPRLGACLSPGTVVTDVGSTKAEIVAAAARALPPSVYFIGGHPMAGKARSGIRQADPILLQDAPYVLCPGATTGLPLNRLRRWVRALGAQPIILDALTHDRLVAYVSHLPQIVSTALANLMTRSLPDGAQDLAVQLSAGAFRDMVRLAASPYEVWGDIAATNREHILRAIDEYLRILEDMKASLAHADLESSFARANQFYREYTRLKRRPR